MMLYSNKQFNNVFYNIFPTHVFSEELLPPPRCIRKTTPFDPPIAERSVLAPNRNDFVCSAAAL